MNKGLYLYCILDSPEKVKIDLLGIDNIHKPYVMSYQGVGVLVSEVSLIDFGQKELERKVRDLDWLHDKANRHEILIEQAMELTTVIPITFGTVFESKIELKELLKESIPKIKELFAIVKGHEEWGLKLYCDFSQLRRTISGLHDGIKELKRCLENSEEGMEQFLERRLEMELDKEVKNKAFSVADEVYEKLSSIATKSHLNELLDIEITGISKPMVLNSVYLINKQYVANFLLKLKEFEDKYSEFGFYFYYSGPWPPYNFSSLEL
ncbi:MULTISPECIES: GvpL/GvpF family gas vesicle protein [unclassified Candidatus Frackibacter]|uniref:GvpL/GvpF family gas vesicle protein n=1 Tax=unclassified Candidatus Frackibacter TaxID=2648818 RepID=UPI00088F062C|nr:MULTISPECIES: GvpL/GvpF family gas vesicle protein [unclassified Candidatus Frackibacter]SDC65912.1 Gas vesicle synthesis protein GvpL/GvpF [Candidatus Frackibacter sp. WG11]SEM79032.1 Gas vesicle synthesis protein GvpL/GvpF [Candidatus Frackibacter sp. WG12]SFL89816.1 Gas vesicle synthesis protein GvpL/GvpF [Candidatus Frackibacter sp. WG13]